MALTGLGTQASPYEITSYADLKEYSDDTSYTGNYLKLMNNIDCKTYGSKFVWNTITFRGDSINNYAYFDLNGKTIKNVSINTGGYMFNSDFANDTVTYISNGNLENIYGYTATGIFYGYIDCDNIGMSIDLTGLKENAFGYNNKHTNLHNCGVRLKCSNGVKTIFQRGYVRDTSRIPVIIEDTDFVVDLTGGMALISSGYYNTSGYMSDEVKNCRFTGIVYGWYHTFVASNHLTNCVFDVDFSGTYYGDYNPTWYANRQYPCSGDDINGVVINVDSIPTYEQAQGYTEISGISATYNQIRTGSWLREHNFEVVNVSS